MKTIKQLADELGVSKTAIRNYMDDDFRAKYTAKDSKGVITITPEGCKLISENFSKPAENPAKQVPETVSGDMVLLLQTTIETLRQQLEVKDRQIAELTRLADQAQRLHAGTMQALPEGSSEPAPAVPSAPIIEPDSEPSAQSPKRGFFQALKSFFN